jgi:hypothetical protein
MENTINTQDAAGIQSLNQSLWTDMSENDLAELADVGACKYGKKDDQE